MDNQKTACLLGASGLVGGHLLDLLLDDSYYDKIIVVNRKSLSLADHPRTKEVVIENFDELTNFTDVLKATDYFCCLGTTINKAGSKANFRQVDFNYIVDFASVAKENDATSFHLISAMGADSGSFIFYNKVKGETEEAVRAMKIKFTHIYRPSLITGERNEKRTGEEVAEWFMKKLSFILIGPLKKYKPVAAKQIAHAMKQSAKTQQEHFNLLESDDIQAVQ